jgi:predicted HAD superfamily Cof-like phosphohydrolase
MNRRGFLGAITAAISAVRLPAVAKAVPPTVVVNAGGAFVFLGPKLFDFGRQIGLALKLPDGRMHAARMTLEYVVGEGWTTREATEIELKRHLLDWAAKQYGVAA